MPAEDPSSIVSVFVWVVVIVDVVCADVSVVVIVVLAVEVDDTVCVIVVWAEDTVVVIVAVLTVVDVVIIVVVDVTVAVAVVVDNNVTVLVLVVLIVVVMIPLTPWVTTSIVVPSAPRISALSRDIESPGSGLEIGTDNVPTVPAVPSMFHHLYSSNTGPSSGRSVDFAPAINPVSVVCDVSRVIVFETFIENWNSDTEVGLVIASVRIQPVSQFCI